MLRKWTSSQYLLQKLQNNKKTKIQLFLNCPSVHLAVIHLHFQHVHVSLTYIFTVLLPRRVSVQFAPSSGGCSHFNLNSVAVWFINVSKKKSWFVYNKTVKMVRLKNKLLYTAVLCKYKLEFGFCRLLITGFCGSMHCSNIYTVSLWYRCVDFRLRTQCPNCE